MSDLSPEHVETLAEVLRKAGVMTPQSLHPQHLAEALAPTVAAMLAQARADALRKAADEVAPALQNEVGGHTSTYSVRQWLHEQATAALATPTTEDQ